MSVKTLPFQWWSKSWKFFRWGQTGQYPKFWGCFCGSCHFSDSRYPQTPPKLQNRCFWVSYNIPPNFKLKYWQEKFVC